LRVQFSAQQNMSIGRLIGKRNVRYAGCVEVLLISHKQRLLFLAAKGWIDIHTLTQAHKRNTYKHVKYLLQVITALTWEIKTGQTDRRADGRTDGHTALVVVCSIYYVCQNWWISLTHFIITSENVKQLVAVNSDALCIRVMCEVPTTMPATTASESTTPSSYCFELVFHPHNAHAILFRPSVLDLWDILAYCCCIVGDIFNEYLTCEWRKWWTDRWHDNEYVVKAAYILDLWVVIVIIIITTTMFMVLSSWPKSLRELTRFIWWM